MTLLEQLKNKTAFLTVAETSTLLRTHPVTIRDWIRAGTLPAARFGSKWAVDPGELAAWITARRTALE